MTFCWFVCKCVTVLQSSSFGKLKVLNCTIWEGWAKCPAGNSKCTILYQNKNIQFWYKIVLLLASAFWVQYSSVLYPKLSQSRHWPWFVTVLGMYNTIPSWFNGLTRSFLYFYIFLFLYFHIVLFYFYIFLFYYPFFYYFLVF